MIDEIKRLPDLFPVLRGLVDRPDNPQRLLLFGSASRDLICLSSEDILPVTFKVRLLHPWHANVAKRRVKALKLYRRDSGLLHALMGIADRPKITRSMQAAIETLELAEPRLVHPDNKSFPLSEKIRVNDFDDLFRA